MSLVAVTDLEALRDMRSMSLPYKVRECSRKMLEESGRMPLPVAAVRDLAQVVTEIHGIPERGSRCNRTEGSAIRCLFKREHSQRPRNAVAGSISEKISAPEQADGCRCCDSAPLIASCLSGSHLRRRQVEKPAVPVQTTARQDPRTRLPGQHEPAWPRLSPKSIMRLLLTAPDALSDDHTTQLNGLHNQANSGTGFRAPDQSNLRSFTCGPDLDINAITAAVTLSYRNSRAQRQVKIAKDRG